MPSEFVFDQPHARAFERARVNFLRQILPHCKKELELSSALDVGCGVGYFAALLRELDFEVTGIEGRPENAEEARSRLPGLNVHIGDVEEMPALGVGSFDLVLALGLLYHLENPFRVIRQLRAATRKLLIIESMCVNDAEPVLRLRDEERGEDQGLRYIAFYPSEACLAKMLFRAGFPFVYRFVKLPDHADFSARWAKRRVRTMMAAANQPLSTPYLAPMQEPVSASDPWGSTLGRAWHNVSRLGGFAAKPWPEKIAALRRRFGSVNIRESKRQA